MKYENIRVVDEEKTIINAIAIFDDGTTQLQAILPDNPDFKKLMAGEFGAIADYVAPPFNSEFVENEYRRRINGALQGKDGSMQREAIYLQNIVMLGGSLTDDQKASADMFRVINDWETAMIEQREALIVDEDTASAVLDATWPAPPAGLAEFLNGF